MSGGRTLILGYWWRHGFAALEPFIASLLHTDYDGDVCVLVDDVPSDTVMQLQAQGVIVQRAAPSGQPVMTPSASRYFSYLDFLAPRAGDYTHVLLADPRHVVFQTEPFASLLPGEIIYARENRLIGDDADRHSELVAAYGEAVAANLRDCAVSPAAVVMGSAQGMLRYLTAMTRGLAARTPPIIDGTDQAVHHAVVHMLPLRYARMDTSDTCLAPLRGLPDAAIGLDERGILIDGRLPPVLCHWDDGAMTRRYVQSAMRFRVAALAPARPVAASRDAVLAVYHRARDAEWLTLFLSSLRCAGFTGAVHCIGSFDPPERALLSQYHATAHACDEMRPETIDNLAHFCLAQVLGQLADSATPPDHVLLLDTVRAVFPRDPFLGKTIGLSLFSEGQQPLGRSPYNLERLALFGGADRPLTQHPIISSAVLRGSLPVTLAFYRLLLGQFVGRSHLLGIEKVVQGAFNKFGHSSSLGFPVILHTHASEVVFDQWPSGLTVSTKLGVRLGETIPGVVLGAYTESPLLRSIRINLGLPAS